MKRLNRIFVTSLLALSLAAGVTACGKGEGDTTQKNTETQSQKPSEPESSQKETETTPADTKVTYKVTLVDETGNPIADVDVQLCSDVCYLPDTTDANGVVTFELDENQYKAKLVELPEGYEYTTTPDSDGYIAAYESGATELTITLKKAE